MKKIVLAAAACAVLISAPAFAADLPEAVMEAPIAVPSFTWTGFYVGVQAGYAWGDSKSDIVGFNFKNKPDGLIVGGYAGYNYQFDNSPLVVGIETDFNYADLSDKGRVVGLRTKSDVNWTGATRARLGYAFDHFLVFAAGGVAYADREIKIQAVGKDSKTALGWTVGGGVEYAATDNIAVRVEYRYTDYGSDKFSIGGFRTKSDLDEHRVLAGVSYKFGW
jgi:outer membrane immunogenic protein